MARPVAEQLSVQRHSPLGANLWAAMTLYKSTPDKAVPVALLGEDYPGLRVKLAVAQGDTVAVGQTLFYDAKRPAIAFASPIQGRVAEIRSGPRRMFAAMGLEPVEQGPRPPADRLNNDDDLRAYLLARGMWPAFVARPFGGPPDPDAQPDAIIINAVPSSQDGLTPQHVLLSREAEFGRGLQALTLLTRGTVHLCVDHGSLLTAPESTSIRVHTKRPTRSWRSTSGQVAMVHPTDATGQVWTVGYQDVIAIGHLLETGNYDPFRSISLRPSGTRLTFELRVPLGASLRHVFAGKTTLDPNPPLMSGTARHGRPATFLGRHHDQAGMAGNTTVRAVSVPQPLIPFVGLNRVLPARIPAVPLMRALSIGDSSTSAKLGCLELLEEDLAPLSALCTSGTDYGQCLRDVLDQLRKDAA